jgi:glycosyltransferase involved in cell wall biosynthesis
MEVQVGLSGQSGTPAHRRKILYIQPGTHSFAGIEHVVDTICRKLTEKYPADFEIDVLYTTTHSNRPPGQNYNSIDRSPRSRLDLMRTFREVIAAKDYDLVVVPQIEPAVIAMASCLGIRRNFAVHLHGNPWREQSHVKARILFFLMRTYFLRRASYVFGTSPRQLASFKAMFRSRTPQYWVPNPVRRFDLVDVQKAADADERVTFVNVGRFSYQKGQDILLRAFCELVRLRPNVRLKIVGHGSGEAELRNEISRLGLDETVAIEHHPDNPQPALAASDVYVSTSRWEGWSLAICEALRFGLPVIATDCEFGPSDILVDPRLGRLVADGGAPLVDAMIYYCDNLAAERANARFREDFIDQYSAENVVDIHADALRVAAG